MYKGRWKNDGNERLAPFYEYLKEVKGYNRSKLEYAQQNNLYFDSNIPEGYGMGSSGALTAAAFELFCDFKNLSQLDLKEKLAETENYFHGNSSGLDPLTIYLNKTILVDGPEIMTVDDPKFEGQFSLINSNLKRNTKTLINYYKSQINKSNFANALIELNELNEKAIHALLSSEMKAMKSIMHNISQLQYQYFDYMIPKHMKNIWKAGLNTGDYSMKLSGAGGGGYFLIFGDYTSILKKHSVIKL